MKAAIVDDEINNINNLVALLKTYCPDVELVGTASNATDALSLIRANQIDLLFLDVQMPGQSGFDLLVELHDHSFEVIFVTAFDKYAIKAIKYSALDFLLKPIDISELVAAVAKAGQKDERKYSARQVENLLINLGKPKAGMEQIALQLLNEIRFVQLSQIRYCKSENNYTIFLLANDEKIIVSKGIYEFQDLLPTDIFIRCHQSYLVNRNYVKSFHSKDGAWHLEMNDHSTIPVSRSRKDLVKQTLLSST